MNIKLLAAGVSLATGPAMGDCANLFRFYFVYWDFSECATCLDTLGWAYAAAGTSHVGCSENAVCEPAGSVDVGEHGCPGSGAWAFAPYDPGPCASASSEVEAGLTGYIELSTNIPCVLYGQCLENSVGVAAAVAGAFVRMTDYTCRSTVSVSVYGSSGTGATSNATRIETEAVILLMDCGESGVNADCVANWSSALGSLDGGLDPNDEATLTGTVCSGTTDMSILAVHFNPDQMDVDGDGRFNGADVSALEAELESTDEDLLFRFDFNDSGDIDEDDVAVLDALITCELGHGLFGDLDGDGDTDCDDFDLLPSSPSYTLGDAYYQFELDADLDGDNDASDRAAAWEVLQPADWDNDGDVDFFDTQAYLADYAAQEPAADLNGDEAWDFYDVQIYLAQYSNACS